MKKSILEKNPEIRDLMVELIERGISIRTACNHLSINETTHYNWYNAGEKIHQQLESPRSKKSESQLSASELEYLGYFRAVKEVTEKTKIIAIEKIREAFVGGYEYEETVNEYDGEGELKASKVTKKVTLPDWKAAKFWLERKHSDEFAFRNEDYIRKEVYKAMADLQGEIMGRLKGKSRADFMAAMAEIMEAFQKQIE